MVQQSDCSPKDSLTFSFTGNIILLLWSTCNVKGDVWTKVDGAGNAGRLKIVTFWSSKGT